MANGFRRTAEIVLTFIGGNVVKRGGRLVFERFADKRSVNK